MELRQLIQVFRNDILFFTGFVLFCIVISLLWQKNQEPRYQATLLLNIGRSGVEQTTEYTYDSFYRLQADERFADTVVRWLSSPRVVEDIYKEAGLDATVLGERDLKKVFKASRLSSQIIEVTYASSDEKMLEKLSRSSTVVLGRYTDQLNKEGKEQNWFVVVGSDPVVRDARMDSPLAFTIGLGLGVFMGFWIVLLRYYLKED